MASVALVADQRLELPGPVDEDQSAVGDVGRHSALEVWRELISVPICTYC